MLLRLQANILSVQLFAYKRIAPIKHDHWPPNTQQFQHKIFLRRCYSTHTKRLFLSFSFSFQIRHVDTKALKEFPVWTVIRTLATISTHIITLEYFLCIVVVVVVFVKMNRHSIKINGDYQSSTFFAQFHHILNSSPFFLQ